MELKDFIKNIIADITNAVKESQEELGNGAIVSPNNIVDNGHSNSTLIIDGKTKDRLAVANIDFEVMVTVEDENNNTGESGGQIKVASILVGGKKKEYAENNKNMETSKVKFSIPVIYPYTHITRSKPLS